MLKRIIKATLSAVLALAMIGTMSGCSYWNGYSKGECKQLVADALEEKYGEEFVVVDIGTGSGGSYYSPGYLTATCHPKNDETIYFEAEYFEYGKSSYELDDLYIQSIVRKQIKDVVDPVLAENFDDFASEIYIYGLSSKYDSGIRNVNEVTIESFALSTTQEGKQNLSAMWIILDETQIQEEEQMLNILSKFNKSLNNMHIAIDVCYVPKDVLEKCKELTNTTDHNPTDIRKLVGSKYLLHEYSFNGATQTIRYLREIDYEELRKEIE